MKTPMATPKAAFQRPMQFNERIVADSFYIWDSENTKYAVARIGHVLPVPDCGGSSRPFLRSDNCTITRSMDWGFWTAGSFDVTDQGSEFHGQLEPLLTTFGTFHEMVSPDSALAHVFS